MNRHLSIFTPFHDSARENNLTRALAITLMKEPLLLSLLYKDITKEVFSLSPISIDTEVYANSINLEDRVINKIYGVTLSTVDYHNIKLSTSINTQEPRLDLVIQLGETLIVIEVKRHGEDPREQLANQIERLDGNSGEWIYKSFTWQKVNDLAFETLKFKEELGAPKPYLDEYKSFIENNFQELLPSVKLSSNENINEVLIDRRLKQIKKEVNKLIHGEDFDEEISYIKLKNTSIAERFEIRISGNEYLDLFVWPGDNRSQGRNLYKKPFILKEVLERLKPSIEKDDGLVDAYSYIRFAHIMGQGICWAHFPIDHSRDVSEVFHEISHMIYKKDMEKWDQITTKIGNYITNTEEFPEKFDLEFTNSGRNFCNVNVGNEIKVSIPLKIVEEWEKKEETAINVNKYIDKTMSAIYPG